MDGVHVHGPATHGRIVNVKGRTNDDQVALNADDLNMYEMSRGPISDLQVDGIWADNGFTAVRLLSSGSLISRVRISNIFGTFRFYGVSFTFDNIHPGAPSTFEDIVIDGMFCSKPTEELILPMAYEWVPPTTPLIWFGPDTVTRGVHVQQLHRTEHADPAPPSIVVDADAVVDYLAISEASLVNHGRGEVSLLQNHGTIGTLSLTNVRASAVGGPARGMVVENTGTIERVNCVNVTEENLSA
jgi:hypothetical protein